MSDNTAKRTGKSFGNMFKRLFVRDKVDRNILEEEALRTPMKAVLLKLSRDKVAIIGACILVTILLFSFVGAALNPHNEFYTELTNMNLRPSRNFLNHPAELENYNIVKIVSGVSFSAALTDDGNIHMWGTEPNRALEGIAEYIFDIPQAWELMKRGMVWASRNGRQ